MPAGGQRLRQVVGSTLFVALLVLALGGALLTRFPDAAIVEQAAEWPLVGGAVRALRERYLPSSAPHGRSARSGDPEVVVIVGEARPTVWVDEGAVLRAAPDDASEAVATVGALTNLPVVERRDDWAWVDFRGVLGWVVPRAVAEHGPALGSRPDPVLPIAARPPEAAMLASGLERFSRQPSEYRFGGYRLYTDWPGTRLLERCRGLEAGLEEAYLDLFELAPVGEPAEVVLLFTQKRDYETFWRQTGQRIDSVGHAGRGVVATYVGLRRPLEICATVIHELTHLLNRRAVGPALPPWLEEGMATEVAARYAGGVLDPRLVRQALRQGSLPDLVHLLELDRPQFHAAGLRRVHYEQSALWLRFLLEDPELGERLLAFLAYLARGGPYAPGLRPDELRAERATITLADDLAAFLDEDLEALDERFRRQLAIE